MWFLREFGNIRQTVDLDFVSIGIDGNDYHVWNAFNQYRPKLLMIEFNPTIPPGVKHVQPADPRINFGSSLAALMDLGKTKRYELVCVYGVNAFLCAGIIMVFLTIYQSRMPRFFRAAHICLARAKCALAMF